MHLLPWDEAAVTEEIRRVTAGLLIASPQVTPVAGAPGTWWVGAGGLEALGGDEALARALVRIAQGWHPGARVAIADSCVAARAATWEQRGASGDDWRGHVVIVPPGGCAAYLDRVPLGLVPMDEALREALVALGIRTAGPLAALAAEDVERRWGATGLAAWRLARGEDARRPVLARVDLPRSVTAELTPSVETTEPIVFLVRSALDRLVRELIADGRAAAVVAVTLMLDDGRGALPGGGSTHTITREVRLPHPLARTVPLLERVRALLDRWVLVAPVRGVKVAITATAPLTGEQGDLLDPAWRDPAAADAAFARLRSELGAEAIVWPVARDEHRPERAGEWVEVEGGEEGGMKDKGQTLPVSLTAQRAGEEGEGGEGRRRAFVMRGAPPKTESHPDASMGHHHSTASRGISFPPSAAAALHLSSHASAPAPLPFPGGGRPAVPLRLTTSGDAPPPPLPPASPADLPVACNTPALRQLEVPEPVDVECVGETPQSLRWRGQRIRVRRAVGPERLTGDWWKDTYARDYWRCEADDGLGNLVLFRDGRSARSNGGWYVQGWYD